MFLNVSIAPALHTKTATGEGTGLGLAITQANVLAHRGHITSASTSADGQTCFTVDLPGD